MKSSELLNKESYKLIEFYSLKEQLALAEAINDVTSQFMSTEQGLKII